jgi:hypothetical protein
LARSGNGIDIGAVYQLLTEVAETVRGHSARFERLDARFEGLGARFEGLDARFERLEARLDDVAVGLSDLRSAVTNYHGAVLGHGIMLSELDERVRRIERHLKLEPAEK